MASVIWARVWGVWRAHLRGRGTHHQEHRDGPPNERDLLLSGTFLAFHLRKMSDSQNVRNMLVNNKFLRVTEHISPSLSKKSLHAPFWNLHRHTVCTTGLLLSNITHFPPSGNDFETRSYPLETYSWILAPGHASPCFVKLLLNVLWERSGKASTKSTAEDTGSESFIHLLIHLLFQEIFEELVHGTGQNLC